MEDQAGIASPAPAHRDAVAGQLHHLCCAECEACLATLECVDEELLYCAVCSNSLHSKRARSWHRVRPVRTCDECEAAVARVRCRSCGGKQSSREPLVFCCDCSARLHSKRARLYHQVEAICSSSSSSSKEEVPKKEADPSSASVKQEPDAGVPLATNPLPDPGRQATTHTYRYLPKEETNTCINVSKDAPIDIYINASKHASILPTLRPEATFPYMHVPAEAQAGSNTTSNVYSQEAEAGTTTSAKPGIRLPTPGSTQSSPYESHFCTKALPKTWRFADSCKEALFFNHVDQLTEGSPEKSSDGAGLPSNDLPKEVLLHDQSMPLRQLLQNMLGQTIPQSQLPPSCTPVEVLPQRIPQPPDVDISKKAVSNHNHGSAPSLNQKMDLASKPMEVPGNPSTVPANKSTELPGKKQFPVPDTSNLLSDEIFPERVLEPSAGTSLTESSWDEVYPFVSQGSSRKYEAAADLLEQRAGEGKEGSPTTSVEDSSRIYSEEDTSADDETFSTTKYLRGSVTLEAFVTTGDDIDGIEGILGNADRNQSTERFRGKMQKILKRGLHLSTPDAEAQQALEKVHRCLIKYNLWQVHRHLKKYNLQQADVMRASLQKRKSLRGGMCIVEFRSIGRNIRGRLDCWVYDLARTIAKYFDTDYCSQRLLVIFYGIKQNADCAGHTLAATFNRVTEISADFIPQKLLDGGDATELNKFEECAANKSVFSRKSRVSYRNGLVESLFKPLQVEWKSRSYLGNQETDRKRKETDCMGTESLKDVTNSHRLSDAMQGVPESSLKKYGLETVTALILHSRVVGRKFLMKNNWTVVASKLQRPFLW